MTTVKLKYLTLENYISSVQNIVNSTIDKYGTAVWDNPTNIGKFQVLQHLINKYDKTLIVSQSYDINRQWNRYPDLAENSVFITYTMLSSISADELCSFCSPYDLIIFDEAHHTGAAGYCVNVTEIIDSNSISAKTFGVTTHTRRYSDSAEDVADTIFHGHKIDGITFEEAIVKGFLPQFDYVSALYSLTKDIDDIVARSSLARKIISDSKLVQANEEEIQNIIKKHMPGKDRKVMFFVPSIEDSDDAEKLSKELGYGTTYVINYTKTDAENRKALDDYNKAKSASIVCISKFNEGEIPEGTNTVVILRKTMTINVYERQVLAALSSAKEKPIIYDFVSNIDNLIYSSKTYNDNSGNNYIKHISSLCNQSIVVDYARPWISVFNKIRGLSQNGWTESQDRLLARYFPKYGEDVYKYITSHSKKECLFRAEMLGLKYEPPKEEVVTEDEPTVPFTFPVMKVIDSMDGKYGFTRNFVKRVVKAYKQTLKTSGFDFDILREIDEFRKSQPEDYPLVENIRILIGACVNSTTVNDPEYKSVIEKNENLFRNRVANYVEKPLHKKASNLVIIDKKAYKEDEAGKVIDKRKRDKEREGQVLVGDTYMGNKCTVAGNIGNSEAEHTLYKTYLRMATNRYKNAVVRILARDLSLEEAIEKINNLRNGRMPWTENEIKIMKETKRKMEAYSALMKYHSDLDIVEKAKELGERGFEAFAVQQTKSLEKYYADFVAEYKVVAKELNDAKLYKELQRKQAEENHLKKEARKKQLKNMKAKVLIVSGKSGSK